MPSPAARGCTETQHHPSHALQSQLALVNKLQAELLQAEHGLTLPAAFQ